MLALTWVLFLGGRRGDARQDPVRESTNFGFPRRPRTAKVEEDAALLWLLYGGDTEYLEIYGPVALLVGVVKGCFKRSAITGHSGRQANVALLPLNFVGGTSMMV